MNGPLTVVEKIRVPGGTRDAHANLVPLVAARSVIGTDRAT